MKEDPPVVKKIQSAFSPFARFAQDQVTASALLLVCTLIALTWANSPYADSYHEIFTTKFGLHLDEFNLDMSLEAWISEGLMALFFFFLGLEIKRELIAGELRDWRRSVPVIMASAGGMIFPALFYLMGNFGDQPEIQGWGIPMATDTAFAVGILALLRGKVPAGLALFVTALAIIDDIGAMLVIALVYTESIALEPLLTVAAITAALGVINWVGVRRPIVYFAGGVWIWIELHASGVHPTIAGVLVALTIPARSEVSPAWFMRNVQQLLKRFEYIKRRKRGESVLSDTEQHEVVSQVEENAERASTPLRRWENQFEKPITLLVMPLFALANAGITFAPDFIDKLVSNTASLGIFAGLVLGKPLGIVLMTQISLWLGWGRLPTGVDIKHVLGIGLLAGIGFTMSLLVATLAFEDSAQMLAIAKSAILSSSLVAGVGAYVWLRFFTENPGDSSTQRPKATTGATRATPKAG